SAGSATNVSRSTSTKSSPTGTYPAVLPPHLYARARVVGCFLGPDSPLPGFFITPNRPSYDSLVHRGILKEWSEPSAKSLQDFPTHLYAPTPFTRKPRPPPTPRVVYSDSGVRAGGGQAAAGVVGGQ